MLVMVQLDWISFLLKVLVSVITISYYTERTENEVIMLLLYMSCKEAIEKNFYKKSFLLPRLFGENIG